MRFRAIMMAIAAGGAVLFVSAGPGLAAQPSPEETGRVTKLPETAGDHLALAKTYEEKAAEWRKEAVYHREMAAAFKKSHPDFKGIRNPEALTMEKHCGRISRDADKLAADAEDAAKYHHLRAKELQGQ